MTGAPAISTRTATRAGASLERLHTFTLLPAADPSSLGLPSTMRPGPLADRAIHDDLEAALRERGYRESAREPDFLVAYLAGAGDVRDIPEQPSAFGAWSHPLSGAVAGGEGGSVIIDVIDARTRRLVWRGQGATTLPLRSGEASKRLAQTVRAVVDRFPSATRTNRH